MNSHTAPPEARRTITRLYKVFSRYKREEIRCEMTDRLLIDTRRPLREFTHEDLDYYSRKAMTTLGSREDFKHFLPRLLELSTQPDSRGTGIDVGRVLMKLEYGECRKWPEGEKAALLEFFSSFWRPALTVPNAGPYAEDLLEGIALFADELTPYLREWQSSDDLEALRSLCSYIPYVTHGIRKEKSPPARLVYRWINLDPTPLLRWLIDPATEASLEARFFRHAEEPVAQHVSRAIEELRWLRPGLAERI
jgi:hypothetical protein